MNTPTLSLYNGTLVIHTFRTDETEADPEVSLTFTESNSAETKLFKEDIVVLRLSRDQANQLGLMLINSAHECEIDL